MKLLYTLLFFTASAPLFAQQPDKGFSRKHKTTLPVDNLSLRIGAEELPVPTVRKGKQSLIGGPATQTGLQPFRVRVVRDGDTGLPIYIENRSALSRSGKVQPAPTGQARANAVASTYQFLNQVRGLMKIDTPEASFSVRQTETDALGQTHVRLAQTYAGVPVYGAELVAHLINNEVTLVNGHYQTVNEGISVLDIEV